MADDDPWLLKEDGYLYVNAECKSIVYHPNLNVLLITTVSGQVYVFDVNFGVILQRSSLSGKADGRLQGIYLADGVDKVLYTDGHGIGVRSDYNGVLLLDTILQTPITRGEDIIKMELLLSEAILLNQCLKLITLPGVDHVQEVVQELTSKIHAAQGTQKKGIKAQKWNTICLELPHTALKLVCSGLVAELKKQNKHIPALPIASAINERLNGLLRGLTFEGGPADRALMFSEAARRETFSTWPHMNYKWALPGQMAQAGFYYEPNSTADDRAMCFTCNVCLVCWESTDEPWSEHERHLPTCPFVKGEYTQNVPLSVTLATAPARESSEPVDLIGTTNVSGLVATASHKGLVNVWNISNQLKSEVSFCVASRNQEANNKDAIQFFAARSLSSAFLSNLSSESEALVEYDGASSQTVNLTALSIIRGPKSQSDESKMSAGSVMTQSSINSEITSDSSVRPCLVCGVSVASSNSTNLRTLENVWAASTDLAPSSSLVRAMNSVNSAASDSLDIMKVAGDRSNIVKNHYLVLYDFHHKAPTPQTSKEETGKSGKTKKSTSGTGTSASSNGGRQESLYQDMFSKFWFEVPVIENVDCEMVGVNHYDGIFQSATLPTSSSNSLHNSTSLGLSQSPWDANFNPINSSEQFPSTSDISVKKTLEVTKNAKSDPVVLQTLCIEAPSMLKISYIGATKDGRHLYVSLVPNTEIASSSEASPTPNANEMDVDEESDIFSSKNLERMFWDDDGASSDVKVNGEEHNEQAPLTARLLIYALDFSSKAVKLVPKPVITRELPAEQAPVEQVFLPLQDRHRGVKIEDTIEQSQEPRGQIALVCKDGIVRIFDLATLKVVTEARPSERAAKFVSAAYCTSLERLCVCSSDGDLNFFCTNEEDDDDEVEDKDDPDDVTMITEAASTANTRENEVPGTSSSSAAYQEPVIAHRSSLSYNDLRNLYELTRFDRHSPVNGANVPPCWNLMMQAQRQRRYPQHLHQSEDQHHTRTWRLQHDATTWDEHIFELTLSRSAAGCIGHVDVRFILHWPCLELPTIQVTLLEQKMAGLGQYRSPLTPVDDRIDFSLDGEQKGENPVISEEYHRLHNTEILCGPINLQRCTDLSDHSGCVTLTSPKLFSTKARTLLVHIKALIDPAKDGATSKSKTNLFDTKPPTSKKLRIDEVGPLLPGTTADILAASANKKLECYIGCDWIHELSITVRAVQPTNIPNERLQRTSMLDSTFFIENLLTVACLEGPDKTLVAQSLALDILIWVVAIKLTRLRDGQSATETRAMQLDTVRCVQSRLTPLLRTCLLHAGRSIAHKCVKLIMLCSEGLYNTDDPNPHSFDEAVLAVLVDLLPSVVSVQFAGSLRWLALLITRLLPLDRNHAVAQQCITIIQQISAEMSNRVNPYHLLLAMRFGLNNSPFETELFDIEPPMPPKSSSMPVTYATVVSGEQGSSSSTTSTTSAYVQDTIDLRDLLTLPNHSNGEHVVPSKLKALCANHSMKGLLEVEPLHFTCHAASDGTKMEKIDPNPTTVNIGTALFDTGVTTNNVMPEFKSIVNQSTYNLETGSLLPDFRAKIRGKLSDLLSICKAELTKKAANQLCITPDDQSDSDEPKNFAGENPFWHGEQTDTSNSQTLASSVTKEKSPIANIAAGAHKVEDNNVKKREDVTFPWGRLLCWPPQQALVVERMHSGARRFVVLDFGSPILLTDLMIPSCSDLVSLSIDIWTKSEEVDGIRLIVAGDIGTKPLAVNDLQPPPVCRYLKITTIGRYGMSTARCRIPLGMFYGHMVSLPGEDYSELGGSQSNSIGNSDSSLQATIDTQCSILSALAEDVQCRFSLATERLKFLLDPLLRTETSNVMHMQHYLNRMKNSGKNKEQPSTKILTTYQECILFQHQLNVVRSVWRRLESWRGCQVTPSVSLTSASSDKLRVLGETLMDILLYTVYEIGPVPSVPLSFCDAFTPSTCESFFHSVCVVTSAPRLQLHAAALLARMAGHQPWWGNFLANTLVNLYSSSSTYIFPQDRVFILLTFLGRKSLIAGANKSSVIDAMVRTLGRLLAPVLIDQSPSASNNLDTTLIGWILLFLSVCLDTTAQQLQSLEENPDKNKEQGATSRWEFLQGESAMQRKYVSANRSASRSYRRKLQKRLMHHKQQLQDLEQAKKVLSTSSQTPSNHLPPGHGHMPIKSNYLPPGYGHIPIKSNHLTGCCGNMHIQSNHFPSVYGHMPKQSNNLSPGNGHMPLQLTHHLPEYKPMSPHVFCPPSSPHSTLKHLQGCGTMPTQVSVLSNKLEAALKWQERFFKKTMNKKFILTVRKNDMQLISRWNRNNSQSNSSRPETLDIDLDLMASLSHQHVLPVARGLIALILNNAANVDMFLLACKVVARLVVSTRPAISLGELMSEEQLLRLVRLATGTSDSAWSSHAVSCLLQDLLEGGRLFPRLSQDQDGNPSEENFEPLGAEGRISEEDLAGVAGTSGSATALGNDEGFAEGDGDEDTQDSFAAPTATTSTSKSNGFNLPSVLESDDSELEDSIEDILDRGKNTLKKGTVPKLPTAASSGISLAIDARLEYGIETGVEISLRRLSTLGVYTLPLSLNATVQIPEVIRSAQPSPRNTAWADRNQEMWNTQDTPSGLSMLTRCFDKIFTDLSLQQNSETSLELVLQLWLTLNLDPTLQQTNFTHYLNPSLTPIIPLSATAIAGLIYALLWHPGPSLRAWCLALQTLTFASNQTLTNDHLDPNISTPLDGLLGGMASVIVKDSNMGPMILRLLSGNGLNVDPADKQYMMAGPRLGLALKDFLVRMKMRCDTITPGSSLGNSLKELLLWVVYQLVQPGGALVARRGPLDAQGILITSLIDLNFTKTDLGTAMSISECVGVLVSTYVRSTKGAQCGGVTDSSHQIGSFGGLFSYGGLKQGRPMTWETLVIVLVKLVCKLVQTPLPDSRLSRTDGSIDMELGESSQRPGTSNAEAQTQLNMSQTDESKVAEQQQSSMRQPQTSVPKARYPCVAHTVLQHEPTMMRLLGALGQSTSFAANEIFAGDDPEPCDLASIPDATFELLSTLLKKATNPSLVLNPLYRYLSSSCAQTGTDYSTGASQLSEPLLWYILKVLNTEEYVAVFTAMGGVKVLCENLVRSNNSSANSSLSSPGVIALVMQHLSNALNLAASASTSSKKSSNNSDSNKETWLNFAPLGTVTWAKPMVNEPPDVLLQSAPPHRRARTAAWSHHFFPGESWVDLTITLPCAILLKEVELQPHLSSLATCPSAVALEVARGPNTDLTPVCPPMPTAGLTSIHLTLSQPEVVTAVLVRLYKPRDCTNISLGQIRILGTTAFGEIKSHSEAIDEEQLTKTSLGWLRLLHQCLTVGSHSSFLVHDVLNSAASVDGLVEACCSLLLLRPRSAYTPNLERVLLQLGLHSRELGLQLINLLLDNSCTPLFQGTSTGKKSSTVQLVVELLQQLCSAQDTNTEARISAILAWLQRSATSAVTRSADALNVVCPPAVYVHCAASVVWKAHENPELTYNLEALLPDELFYALYDWTLTLAAHSALKLAIDSALCALCYVRPSLFPMLLQKVGILVPNLATDRSASISDDRKENEGQTDDRKSENDANEEWYCRFVLPEHKRLQLTEGQLLTVASAARSSPGIQQLIDSGLPGLLSTIISEFCELEKTKEYRDPPSEDERIPSTSNSSMTDSDKAEETANQGRNNANGLCMTEPESVSVILEFLSLICSEGRMRDWLGKEGRSFWLPLVSLLSNRPVENPSVSSLRTNIAYATLESSMIKFLSKCCWCHPNNQKLLSELLTNVILQQRTSENVRYLHGISGFTRRLILQLLLEGEKVLVSVTSETPMTSAGNAISQNILSMPPHPAYPLGYYHQLLYMSTQSTISDVLQQLSGTWLLSRLSNTSGKGSETNASSTPSGRRDAWETGTALMVDTLSVAAGNTAKDKRAKEASNRSQARGPTLRKARYNLEGAPSTSKSPSNSRNNSTSSGTQQYLMHSSSPNVALPSQLTITQLLAMAEDNGGSLSDPYVHLILKEYNKDSKDEPTKANESEMLNYRSIESALGVFSASGGLAVLAKHLPLVYPDSGRPPPFTEKSPSPEQPDADWVKVEVSDDTYVDIDEGGISNSPRITQPAPHVPLHSLAAFGLFLRLPGYAEVLLRDRKQAQCLLRLALGVTDDGEGGDILSSPLATSLPTLPFQVLKQLLEATPPTTDDGLLLRRTTIDVGAVLLLLNCLAIFTHQTGHNEGNDQRIGQPGSRSDDKSHHYWAKGTGFGTGSTQQSWNVEQALLRQRSEEEHVTVLLQVLASYVGSGGQPQRDLPGPFAELLARSCLLPALSSYLRNDSVLDMARHIPLYRAILQLLRAMALSSQLAPLLLPRGGRPNDASIVSLLYTMRMCVDAYVYKINRTRGIKSRSVFKFPDDTEQDEGLATLIPDIQESATIVQSATSRLNVIGEDLARPSPTGPELPLRSVEQRYLEVMKKLQFDTFEIIADNTESGGYKFAVSYHFESHMRTAGDASHPARVKRLAQEAVTLSHALPLSYSSSVFVRCDAERLDIMKVLITGPAETPYANGCFEFDVYFPPDYPNNPMMINLETTGRHSVRFNPNLYNDGKVCLSVLNTWHGRPEEKWNAQTSSFLQVLVSIQSLILVPEPYFNEPGYERSRGTPTAAQSSQEYNANICQATVKWAMLDQIKNPCPCFKEVIHTHFWIKRHEIIAQLQGWVMEMELHVSDRRSSRSILLNAVALRRHFRLLREELNKLPTPEGLEDLVVEPLPSPSTPLEMSELPVTPNSPPAAPLSEAPTSTIVSSENTTSSSAQPPSNPSVSNHVHHDIDTDVEMEKMVSKVCE